MAERHDCIVVGGGPAGLTAAIYLARFHLDTLVLDAGRSRAALIPRTHNHAGFPEGITGPDLLDRMRRQASDFGARIKTAAVSSLVRDGEGFGLSWDGGEARCRSVLLATGVVNLAPPMMDKAAHDAALASGLLRYCPICDGYEVSDRRIAILGSGDRGVREALFLRSYSRHVTLIGPAGAPVPDRRQASTLADAGIAVLHGCYDIRPRGKQIEIYCHGRSERFDTLYPALGSEIRSELARQVGADVSDEGCLIVDAHQRTNVPGLYAAGDVVLGLDQISHAMGEGGVAATTMRNDLAERISLRRV